MKVTFARCDSILKTLPIGFYAGRRVEVGLDEKARTSHYSPFEDKIVVSYPIIAKRFEDMPDTSTCTEEEAVRSMLYHEVSHAILTPKQGLSANPRNNIFEDERIETVLADYYHGVDFRKQLYDICGGYVPMPKDNEGAFFNAVRFGLGTPKVKQMIAEMLKTYAGINRNSPIYSEKTSVCNYERDITRLWSEVCREFAKNPESFRPAIAKSTSSGMAMNNDLKANGKNEGGEEGNNQPAGESSEKTSNKPIAGMGRPHKSPLSKEDIKKIMSESLEQKTSMSSFERRKVAEFQKSAEVIISNFNKKNKEGNGINAYSGVFNPRAVVRQDYRFFDKKITAHGNNKFGTCHLNLIIDRSGSYSSNQNMTNGILAALTEIEKKNPNFSMDVGFIGEEFELCQTIKDRQMHACGGNNIPDNMKEILLKMQKPNTCNYNIVLFDGDALSDCCGKSDKEKCDLFGAFDMKQTTLITDPDNEVYMKPAFTASKVVVTTAYTKELVDNILRAFIVAFG